MKKSKARRFLRKLYNFLNKLFVNRRVAYKNYKEKFFIHLFGNLYNKFFNQNEGLTQNILILANGFYHKRTKEKSLEVLHIVEPLTDFTMRNNPIVGVFPWYYEQNKVFPILRFLYCLYKNRPRVIVLSSHNPYSKQSNHFSYYFFSWVQKTTSQVQFIELGWDTVGSNFWESKKLEIFERKFCIFDQSSLTNYAISKHPNRKDLTETYPTPFTIKNIEELQAWERTVDYSFIGQISSYRDYRFSFIQEIKHLKYNSVLRTSNSRKHQMSRIDYYALLKDSKISVNFSQSVRGSHQIKLRVWEILLSGCLLLEQKNIEIGKYFVDGIHFVSFDSESDLVVKLKYYLENQNLLNDIALNGQQQAISLINERCFEKEILSYT